MCQEGRGNIIWRYFMINKDSRLTQGVGKWDVFTVPMEKMFKVASLWKKQFDGIEKPWLCWKIDDDWCVLQQKLIKEVGWTPVVGYDPSTTAPTILTGSILVDFNAGLGFETMWMHFPLEFTFLFTKRLAFWHSDFLLRHEKMAYYARLFESLENGQVAAVREYNKLKFMFMGQNKRYWELLGCTTAGASESQFKYGSGWWMNFACHANCPPEEKKRRERLYWDHGVGIAFWAQKHRDKVVEISLANIKEGHFTTPGIFKSWTRGRNVKAELIKTLSLKEIATKLKIDDLL
jgi:hypothetical protein